MASPGLPSAAVDDAVLAPSVIETLAKIDPIQTPFWRSPINDIANISDPALQQLLSASCLKFPDRQQIFYQNPSEYPFVWKTKPATSLFIIILYSALSQYDPLPQAPG